MLRSAFAPGAKAKEIPDTGKSPNLVLADGDLFISEDETKLKQKATERRMEHKPELGYGSISLQDSLEGHTIYGRFENFD